MKTTLIALCAGIIFGFGILISGMASPAKILNFFDIFGTWDPSLVFVMGGAMFTTTLGYQLIFRFQKKPLLPIIANEVKFGIPPNKAIDKKLITGSALFGIGWGISGFCPGGAIPVLLSGSEDVIFFLFSMLIGIFLTRRLTK